MTLRPPGGRALRSTNTPLRTVYLAAGSGYRPDADWGHGTWRGEQVVQGLVHDLSTPALRAPWSFLNETLCRFELDTGEVGYGMHENLCVGHPSAERIHDTRRGRALARVRRARGSRGERASTPFR